MSRRQIYTIDFFIDESQYTSLFDVTTSIYGK